MALIRTQLTRFSSVFPTSAEVSNPSARREYPRSLWIAAILTILLPGLGHLAIGQRRRGAVFLGITLATIVVVTAVVPREPFALLALFSQPRSLALLLAVDVAFLAFRLAALADVLRAGGSRLNRQTNTRSSLLPIVLFVALISAPHAAVAYYDIVTWKFLDDVFDSPQTVQRDALPSEVELTREINLKPGVTPNAQPVVANGDTSP